MTITEEKQYIPGYSYGTEDVPRSPINLREWEDLKKSALFSEEDVFYLRFSHDILARAQFEQKWLDYQYEIG